MKTNTLLNRVDTRLAACAACAVATGASMAVTTADASIIYSGVVSIPVPNDIDGVYLNVVTGAFAGQPPPTGWDVNPYSAVAGQFNLWGASTQTWFSTSGLITGPYNLTFGTVIGGPASNFFRPGGGTDIGPQMNLNSSNNYLGFQFTNEANGNQIHFGWMQLQFGATAGDRTIIGYAYDDVAQTSIGAGVVPEPSTFALLGVMAAGALGVREWRKRKAA